MNHTILAHLKENLYIQVSRYAGMHNSSKQISKFASGRCNQGSWQVHLQVFQEYYLPSIQLCNDETK